MGGRRKRFQHLLNFELLEDRRLMADFDDSISEAFMLGAITTSPSSVSASISPDTDVNMVGFDVTAGQVIDFDLDTPNNGPGGLGTYIRLFDAQGNQLAWNNDGMAPGEDVLGFDSYMRYTFPNSGTFYLATSNYNNINYNPITGDGDTAGGLYSTGSYVLIVKALPIDLDDTISEATSLGTVTSTVRTVDTSLVTDIDVNMVSFAVAAGQVVDFDIDTPLNGPGGLGTYIRLFNSQGTQLAFNNDGAAPGENTVGYDSYLRYTFPTTDVYYLGVSNFNNINYNPISGNGDTAGGLHTVGTYQLRIQTAPTLVADPNDSISEATSLGVITATPVTVSASISPDTDVNMVGFNVTAGQTVDFDIDTTLNGTGGLGSYIRLFDISGTQLAFNNDGLAPGDTRLGFDAYLRYTFAAAGTYYLAVSNFNNVQYNPLTGDGDTSGGLNTVGDYQLIVQALPVDTNDSIPEAPQLGLVTSTPITINSSLVTDIDVNIVGFIVNAGQVIDFDIDTPLNGPGGLGSYIRLFNASGQQLAFNNDAAAPGENTAGYDAYLRYTFASGGIYYLGVSNFNNIQYDPTTGSGDSAGGFNSIGSYQLIIQTAPVSVPDPNDTIAEATALGAITTTPITVSTNISPDTDVNMVSFSVSAGLVVDFDIDTTLNGTGGLGSYLRLFNAQGTQLAFNNDGLAPGESVLGFDAYLRYTFDTAGIYYVGVSNFNNIQYNPLTGDGDVSGGQNTIGSYQLIVQALPIDTNDSISESLALGGISTTAITVNASLVTDIDVNMVSFFVSAGQVVDFDIDTPLNGPGGLGSFIRLFNASGQQIAFNNDAAAPGENVVSYDAYMRYTFATGGTYYLGVSNLNNVLYDPLTGNGDTPGGLHSIGSYQLIIQTAPAEYVDPNDTIGEASSLGSVSTNPITVSASISPDIDVNMVSFNVSAGQVVDFDIDTTLNGAGGLGSYIRLFDAQGSQLAFNNDGVAPGESTLGFDAYLRYTFTTSGVYYLGVSNFNNIVYDPVTGNGDSSGGANTTGAYQLIIQGVPVDTNDAISEATSLGLISATPITVSASIVTDIDVNMVSFSVSAGQVVDFDIDTLLNGPGGLGAYIRLFDASGQQLAFNDDAAAPGENITGYDSYLRYTFAAAGKYYLGVSNLNNIQYDAITGNGDNAGGFHSIGSYQLIVQTAPAVVTDPNDAISEATVLGAVSTNPFTVNASISPDTDVNMVSISVGAGQVVDFDIDTTLNGAGGLGSYLRLFDSQGNQVAFNNDGAAPGENVVGFDAYLRYTFVTAGTYYVGVSNSNNIAYDPVTGNGDTSGGANATGPYQLIIQALPIDTNDAISEVASIGTISATPTTVNASIVTDVDVNLVGFSVITGQVVDFDIDTTLNGAGGLGSYIRLFNAQGQMLSFNDNAAAPGEGSVGIDAYLRYTFASGGTYYLGVSNSNNILYDPVTGDGDTSGGLNSIGSYQLIMQTAPAVVSDPNDAISEAGLLGTVSTSPITVSATISPDTDVNMVAFTVSAGQVVDFDIDTTLNGAGGLGSYIRLFDPQGNQLSSNNDGLAPGEGSLGIDSYLRYTFVSGGTFYLGVSNSNNTLYDAISGNGDTAGGSNATGAYQLIIQALPVDSNDAISEAASLGQITSTPQNVSAGIVTDIDVNMVSFSVASGQIVDFDIDTVLNGQGGFGSFIRLFDSQGTELAFNNNAAAPGEGAIGFDAYLRYTFTSGGTYYLGVSNLNNIQYDPLTGNSDTAGGFHSIGSYQLIVQTAPSVVSDPNDAISEAQQLGSISLTPTSVSGSISPDTDVNMVGFTVVAGQVVDFDIDTALNGPGGLASFLRLFNAQGQQLAVGGAAKASDEAVVGFDAYFRYNFATAGTYYVGVSNTSNVVYDAITGNGDTAGGLNAVGSYQLNIQTATIATTDQDDSISEANALGAISASPVSIDFVISPDTDVDMYSFSVAAGQVVDLDIDTVINGTGGLNSYLKLFNAQGQLLDSNNNASAPGEGAIGFDAYLRHSFVTAGNYYLAVSNDSNIQYDPLTGNGDTAGGLNATGAYRLILRSLSTTLTVSINATTIPEKNGSAIGTVSRTDADLSQALTVSLTSSDVGSATVPNSVIIPANQSSMNFTITAVDDHIVSGTKTVTITATATGFSQGTGSLNISDSDSSWHNANNPNDVDADNTVSPLDVLTIVNYLNTVGSGPVTGSSPPPYLDVDSDNFISPLDALVVINYLNSLSNGQGEGEAAVTTAATASTPVPLDFVDDYFANYDRTKPSLRHR